METGFDILKLRHCPLFDGLSDDELRGSLARLDARQCRVSKGEFLLRQGETARSLGILLSGRAHILHEDFWGSRDLIAGLEPGDLFGEAYACAGVPLGVSVQAEEDSAVLFLDVHRLLSQENDSRLLRNLLAVSARKNLQLNEKLTHVTRRTTRAKLLSYLSREATRQGSDNFSIPFDRQQLADYLAVDRSAMSQALGNLRRERLIDFRKNHFALLRHREDETL